MTLHFGQRQGRGGFHVYFFKRRECQVLYFSKGHSENAVWAFLSVFMFDAVIRENRQNSRPENITLLQSASARKLLSMMGFTDLSEFMKKL